MNELVEVEKIDILDESKISDLITREGIPTDVFINSSVLNKLLAALEKEIVSRWCVEVSTDATTEKGRKTLISRARSIASVSARLDEIGKQEVAKLKDLPRQVDAGRRKAREFFEKWKETVRQPVAEWETKQAEVMKLAQVILDHEQALLDNEIWEQEKNRQMQDLIQQQIEQRRKQEEYAIKLREEIKIEIKAEKEVELNTLGVELQVLTPQVELSGPTTFTGLSSGVNSKTMRELCLFIMDKVDIPYTKATDLITAIQNEETPYLRIVYIKE